MKTPRNGRTWSSGFLALVLVFVTASPGLGAEPSETLSDEDLQNHQSFRSNYDFLSDDPDYIRQLVGSSDANDEALKTLGLEMSESEWAEFQRRQELIAEIVPIQRIVTGLALDEESELRDTARLVETGERASTGSLFAGVWLDQLDGGRIKLAVTDADAVDTQAIYSLLPRGAEDLVVIEQRYSRDELEAFKRSIGDAIAAGDVRAATGYDYSEAGIKVRVIPHGQGVDVESITRDVPNDAFVVAEPRDYVLASQPHTTHSSGNQQSGLQIGIWRSGPTLFNSCTWGVTGHTAEYTYIVSAGHCFTPEGTVLSGWGHRWATQNASGNVVSTPSSAFVYARARDSSADYDHGRISSPRANTNCYHAAGDCNSLITERISLYAHAVGQTVCVSLAANASTSLSYDCGTVVDADYNEQGYTNRVEVASVAAHLGDSGAGMRYIDNFHGILTSADVPNQMILFEPAYYVKAFIGASTFDFNCVRSGSWWGSCPISYSN
jgi:hypothetical protein